MDFATVFKKKIKDSKGYLALIEIDAKNYENRISEILKFFLNKKNSPGIYVGMNKPCKIIRKNLNSQNINTKLLIQIDGVTPSENAFKDKCKCLMIGSPERLSDLGIAIEESLNSINHKDKFLVFDSINTLLIHNQPQAVSQFIYYIANKIRKYEIVGILISIKGVSNRKIVDSITPFCDARIELKEGKNE